MTTDRAGTAIPPLVARAMELAERTGFAWSCIPDVGRLLRVLAGHARGGVVGEIGTGCGVGTAWMVGALASDARLVTIELDEDRAALARDLFVAYPNVRVIQGDWRDILPAGPFDLLFIDAGGPKRDEPEAALEVLRPGGMVVLDDMTPEEHWPPEWRGRPDPVRAFWLNSARLDAIELLTTPTTSVILATRVA